MFLNFFSMLLAFLLFVGSGVSADVVGVPVCCWPICGRFYCCFKAPTLKVVVITFASFSFPFSTKGTLSL